MLELCNNMLANVHDNLLLFLFRLVAFLYNALRSLAGLAVSLRNSNMAMAATISRLDGKNADLEAENLFLYFKASSLESEVATLRQGMGRLQEINSRQEKAIDKLTESLSLNSKNSNLPPSTDHFKHFQKPLEKFLKSTEACRNEYSSVFEMCGLLDSSPDNSVHTGARDNCCNSEGTNGDKATEGNTANCGCSKGDGTMKDETSGKADDANASGEQSTKEEQAEVEGPKKTCTLSNGAITIRSDEDGNVISVEGTGKLSDATVDKLLEFANSLKEPDEHEQPSVSQDKPEKGKNPADSKPKPGGQPGHKGKTLSITKDQVNGEMRKHIPLRCQFCPNLKECSPNFKWKDARYTVTVTIHQTIDCDEKGEIVCPEDGRLLEGRFPANVTGRVQYSSACKALAVGCYMTCNSSVAATQKFMSDFLHLGMSVGTVQNAILQAGELAKPYDNFCRLRCREAICLCCDETGTPVYNPLMSKVINEWLHVAYAIEEGYVHYSASDFRGVQGITEGGVVDDLFWGIIVHDFWKSYWSAAPNAIHAICHAHNDREFARVLGVKSLQEMADLMHRGYLRAQELRRECEKAIECGLLPKGTIPAFPSEEIEAFLSEYDSILRNVFIEVGEPYEPEGGIREKKERDFAANLAIRLKDYKHDICRFVLDLRVPYTNNGAEQQLRFYFVVRDHNSYYSRTWKGLRGRARIATVLSTATKRGLDPFEMITGIFEGVPPARLFQDEVKVSTMMTDPQTLQHALVVIPQYVSGAPLMNQPST